VDNNFLSPFIQKFTHRFQRHTGFARIGNRRQNYTGLTQDPLGLSRQELRITWTDTNSKYSRHYSLPFQAEMM